MAESNHEPDNGERAEVRPRPAAGQAEGEALAGRLDAGRPGASDRAAGAPALPGAAAAPDAPPAIGPAGAAPQWRDFYRAVRDAVRDMRSGEEDA
ncbi:hypothetical protein [Paenibacillus lycopersici]|uniref:hypothetical protein n=1 Tax=Paenibacillus lycopersici TaxID=2704462 RepID=UPI0013915C9A|nr:hypothetical protein [Paenibacillus lycopersici]